MADPLVDLDAIVCDLGMGLFHAAGVSALSVVDYYGQAETPGAIIRVHAMPKLWDAVMTPPFTYSQSLLSIYAYLWAALCRVDSGVMLKPMLSEPLAHAMSWAQWFAGIPAEVFSALELADFATRNELAYEVPDVREQLGAELVLDPVFAAGMGESERVCAESALRLTPTGRYLFDLFRHWPWARGEDPWVGFMMVPDEPGLPSTATTQAIHHRTFCGWNLATVPDPFGQVRTWGLAHRGSDQHIEMTLEQP